MERIQADPNDDEWVKITDGEEVCVKRCIDKFLTTRQLMERILQESTSPLFYSEFLASPDAEVKK